MSDTQHASTAATPGTGQVPREPDQPTGWVGWVLFAGVMMLMIGCFHAIMGFVALFDPGYFLVTRNGLVVSVDYTAWGVVHLVLGGVALLAGLAVLAGQLWGRIIGIVMAVVGALVNLTFVAAYPVWTTILIVLDVIVIYALAVHGRETRAYGD